jgi:hypothetical protein
MNLFGTLQNGTSRQLFWRVYSYKPTNIFKKNSPHYFKSIVQVENGEHTKKLRDHVLSYTYKHPEIIKEQKLPLESLNKEDSFRPNGKSLYWYLYGQFNENPELIVNNFFVIEMEDVSSYYSFFIIRAIHNELGLENAEILLRKVAIEAILNNPQILIDWISDGLTLVGFSIFNAIDFLKNPSFNTFYTLFPFWDEYYYINVGFDLAGCATNGLNINLMNEYKFDRNIYNSLNSENLHKFKFYTSTLRNIIRAIFGCVFLIVSLFTLFTLFKFKKNDPFLIIITLYCWIEIFLLGSIAGGVYTRYEVGVLPILILIGFIFINKCIYFKRRIKVRSSTRLSD